MGKKKRELNKILEELEDVSEVNEIGDTMVPFSVAKKCVIDALNALEEKK